MDTFTLDVTSTQEAPPTDVSPGDISSHVLVIGVGERHKHDEQVGLYVARRIREQSHGAIRVVDETNDVLDLMQLWQMADVVFVVDAVVDGKGVGAIHHFEIIPSAGCGEVIPADISFSLRILGLADAIHLAASLHMLPARLIVYGIEAECFKPGEGLSLDVLAAAEQVTREILHYVGLRHSG
jgi:hydrogenase maturation protease